MMPTWSAKHGIEYQAESIELEDEQAALDWMDKNQIGRRNLTPDLFRVMLGRIYNRTKNQGARNDLTSHQSDDKSKTSAIIAEQYKSSPATVERAGAAVAKVEGTPLEAEVLAGNAKLNDSPFTVGFNVGRKSIFLINSLINQ